MRIPVIPIVLLLLVAAAAFLVPVRDGEPWLDWRQVRDHWRQPGFWLSASGKGSGDGSARVYRWRDAHGSWQYGQIPPPGVDAQSVTIRAPTTLTAKEMRGEGQPVQEKQP